MRTLSLITPHGFAQIGSFQPLTHKRSSPIRPPGIRPRHGLRFLMPAGGYSTVADLLKFATALQSHQLLNAEHTELLTTGKTETGGSKYAFGFQGRGDQRGEMFWTRRRSAGNERWLTDLSGSGLRDCGTGECRSTSSNSDCRFHHQSTAEGVRTKT